MNIAYKKVSALIFSALVITSAYGMENENATEVVEQKSPVVWYKKRSVHVAAAITTVAAAYAIAVYMNKIAGPATVAGWFMVQTVQEPTTQEVPVTNVQQGDIVSQIIDTNKIVADASGVVEQCKDIVKNFSKEIVGLWKGCKNSDTCFE